MNLWKKLKKEKTEENLNRKLDITGKRTSEANAEKKFSFRDALGNLKSAMIGKVSDIKNLHGKTTDQSIQSEEMLDLSARLKLHKKQVRIRTVLILTVVLAAAVGYGVYRHVHVYHRYLTVSEKERADDNATQYLFLKRGCILKCNPNGVTCVDSGNKVKWNTTFTMQNPVIDVCGTIVAVADQRGNDVYIFNEKGLVGNFKAEYTLTKIRVAKQGVVAVVLEDGEVSWIYVYDAQGNIIVKNKTTMGKAGYPLDMDISSDGLKMAVAFSGIRNQVLQSKVSFYNFSAVGKDQENNLTKEVQYEGKVVPQVQFLGGDSMVAFRDDGAVVFSGKHVPEEKKEILEEKEIISTCYSDDYFCIITESDEENAAHKYKLECYRKSGVKCFQTYFDMEYDKAKICGEELFLYNGSECMIYTTAGKLKCSIEYKKQITEIMPADGLGKYMMITPDSVDIIKIG